MTAANKRNHKPAITMTRSDHERLSRLAESLPPKTSSIADQLFIELERARVVADEKKLSNTVRMGSSVCFTSDLGENRCVVLVFPSEADIAKNKISILTPIGTALIGLSAGQSIDWTSRDGHVHRLNVQSVSAPGEAFKASTCPELES